MKKKNIILTIVLIICISLIAGTAYLFNEFFPKADPIKHPETKEIVSVMLSWNDPYGTVPMDENYYEDLIQYISDSNPTRKQALNDTPDTSPYYEIVIKTNARQYCYFIYESLDQVYIECPYDGIYEADAELLDFVLGFIYPTGTDHSNTDVHDYMSKISESVVARFETADGKTAVVDSEIALLTSLADLDIHQAPMTPADNPEDWIYRITYNPADKVLNSEEVIVSVHEKYVQIGSEYYLPMGDVDFDSILEWFEGKAAYFLSQE